MCSYFRVEYIGRAAACCTDCSRLSKVLGKSTRVRRTSVVRRKSHKTVTFHLCGAGCEPVSTKFGVFVGFNGVYNRNGLKMPSEESAVFPGRQMEKTHVSI